jgi:glycosyltransferase involved in cell wall biosynthesis
LEERSLLGLVYKLIKKVLYRNVDGIITCTNEIKKIVLKKYNIEEKKVENIYNFYYHNNIHEKSKEKLPSEFENFFERYECIISVGRLMFPKGFWNLVKTFYIVKKEIPNTGLVIVGDDDYEDGKLKKLIKSLGLSNSILLINYDCNPFKYIKRSKVYALTSIYEGFPNSLVEAMICGIPVVSSDCKTGPREILCCDKEKSNEDIIFAEYGILIKPFSWEEDYDPKSFNEVHELFAMAIIQLLTKKKLAKIYSEKAYRRSLFFSSGYYLSRIRAVIEKH